MTKLKVTQKRHFSAHNDLLRVADNFLHACELEGRWCREGDFVCIVMCSLAVESLCNTTGELVFKDWKDDFEKCTPQAKIRILCEKLNITYSRSNEPFQTLHWLISFRNKIAHAKPEPIEKHLFATQKEYQDLCSSIGPQSKLENLINIENAKKSLFQIQEFRRLLSKAIPEEFAWLIERDSWGMESEPIEKS